jgi:hypothetical protein
VIGDVTLLLRLFISSISWYGILRIQERWKVSCDRRISSLSVCLSTLTSSASLARFQFAETDKRASFIGHIISTIMGLISCSCFSLHDLPMPCVNELILGSTLQRTSRSIKCRGQLKNTIGHARDSFVHIFVFPSLMQLTIWSHISSSLEVSAVYGHHQVLSVLQKLLHCMSNLTVFACWNTGIVGSNPIQGMDVCVYSVFVLFCVRGGLATG